MSEIIEIYKALKIRCNTLESELNSYLIDFNKMYKLKKIPKVSTEHKKIRCEPEIKKIFKEISKKIHPDVNTDNNLSITFNDVNNDYQNGNSIGIIEKAKKLEVKVDVDVIPYYNLEINKIEDKIQGMKNSFIYKYKYGSNEDKVIIVAILKKMGVIDG